MVRWQTVGNVLVRQCMVKSEKRGFVSGGGTEGHWVTLPASPADKIEGLIDYLKWREATSFTGLGIPDELYEKYFPEHPIPDFFLGEMR